MKTFIFASLFISSVVCFAQTKKEKITCFAVDQKVSEGIRTTITDGQTESRVSEMTYFNPKTNEVTSGQEIVLMQIEHSADLEIQKASGTYITLGANKKVEVRKMQSVDTYKVAWNSKTLVKSVVDGKDLTLLTTDMETQYSSTLKIYTSILKDSAEQASGLEPAYSCHISLL